MKTLTRNALLEALRSSTHPAASGLAKRLETKIPKGSKCSEQGITISMSSVLEALKYCHDLDPLTEFKATRDGNDLIIKHTVLPGIEKQPQLLALLRDCIGKLENYNTLIAGAEDENLQWEHAQVTVLLSHLQKL